MKDQARPDIGIDGARPVQTSVHHGHLSALQVLIDAVAIATLLGSLGACGGGAPTPAPVPTPPPAPSPKPMPAVMSVPTPLGYDADKMAVFNRLNELRVAAGLGMLAQDSRLDQAAQGHLEWEIANSLFTHVETVGSIGFTGVNWFDRDSAKGYAPIGGSEVSSYGSGPSKSVDGLMLALYHRAALLEFAPVDVGIGWSAVGNPNMSTPLVIDFARPNDGSLRSAGQLAQSSIDGVVIWPIDGSDGFPTHMGEEVPNPVPTEDVMLLGVPASISVDWDQKIEAAVFVLTEDKSGIEVPAVILNSVNDPARSIPPSFIGLVPTLALKINTVYRVDFVGSITPAGSLTSSSYSRTWRFTTGDLAYLPQN